MKRIISIVLALMLVASLSLTVLAADEKGSITIDGISLTVAKLDRESFSVSIIPHTASQTILSLKKSGDIVNLENDCIGKYVDHLLNFNKPNSNITKEFLMKYGY